MGSSVCLGAEALKSMEAQGAQSLLLLQEDCKSPSSSIDKGSQSTYREGCQQLP